VERVYQINAQAALVHATEGIWGCVVSFMPRPFYPTRKEPLVSNEKVTWWVLVAVLSLWNGTTPRSSTCSLRQIGIYNLSLSTDCYIPKGIMNQGGPLKRLLDVWDQNESASGLTPMMVMMMMIKMIICYTFVTILSSSGIE